MLRFQDGDASFVSELELHSRVLENFMRRIIAREVNMEIIMQPIVKLESGSELLEKYSAKRWWKPDTPKPGGESQAK